MSAAVILFVVALVMILVVGRGVVLPWARQRSLRNKDGVALRDHDLPREVAESRSVNAKIAEARARDAEHEDRPEATNASAPGGTSGVG